MPYNKWNVNTYAAHDLNVCDVIIIIKYSSCHAIKKYFYYADVGEFS